MKTALLPLCIFIVWGASAIASNQMMSQAAPLKINRCDAKHNPGSSGGPVYTGYVVGYYPRGAYYWNDPWRHNYYQPAVSPSGTLYIDFVNVTPREMKAIDFGLVARGHLIAEVRDVGKFTPGVEIKHEFGVNPNVFPLGTSLPACPPLKIEFANGSVWTNPQLPAAGEMLYQGHP